MRPLKSKTAAEVTYNRLDIFLILGAAMILQSEYGREFTASIITELKSLWPDLKIVHGRPRHPQSQGSVERANADVKEMLATWLSENNSTQWSEGLRFLDTKTKLTVLSKGDNVIIPIPSVDRGPVDERNIKGVVMNVNEHGGYKIGTKVGQIKGYMSRNQVQFVANATLDVSEVPVSDMSVREIVSKISLSGVQGFVHCQCKKGNCKSGRCKCRRLKVSTLGVICLCHVATSKHSWLLEW